MEALISRTNASRQKEKRLKSPAGRWLCLEEWKERKENLRLLACAVLILRRKCYYCGYGTESRPSFFLSLSSPVRKQCCCFLLFSPPYLSPHLCFPSLSLRSEMYQIQIPSPSTPSIPLDKRRRWAQGKRMEGTPTRWNCEFGDRWRGEMVASPLPSVSPPTERAEEIGKNETGKERWENKEKRNLKEQRGRGRGGGLFWAFLSLRTTEAFPVLLSTLLPPTLKSFSVVSLSSFPLFPPLDLVITGGSEGGGGMMPFIAKEGILLLAAT